MALCSAWWLAAVLLVPTGAPPPPAPVEIGRVTDARLREPSALEASRRFPGVFWTVGDSGNPPYLFALDRTGRVLAAYQVAEAVNADWECVALTDSGRLYIGDVGNNLIAGKSRIPRRWVYVVREPDPRVIPPDETDPAALRTLPLERTIHVKYPAGPFDIEGAFAWREDVYLVSKTRGETALYRLPHPLADEAHEPETAVTLEKTLVLPGLQTATSATLSADGRRLAITTYRDAWIYEATAGAVFQLQEPRPILRLAFRAPAVEACAWDGRNLLLLNELGALYQLQTNESKPQVGHALRE